ncbi:MAG: hypothetical protein R3C14_31230 [Caldilineaceae bacterium]
MTIAEQILVLGGVLNLVYGFITGFMVAMIRQKQSEAPKYLMFAHIGPLMQGAMLLGLVFAVQMSNLSTGTEAVAAALLSGGAFLLAAKDTINWWQSISDEFHEKPVLGLVLGILSVFASSVGLLILLIGVIAGIDLSTF